MAPTSNKPARSGTGNRRRARSKTTARPLSLVTGSCGFIGSHMVEVLHQAGHRVRATDLGESYRTDDPGRGRFPGVLKALGVEFVPSDLTRPATLREAVKGVDYVFHVAGLFSYSAPWEALRKVNVDGTRELCGLVAAEKGFRRLVLWGAGGVYGFPPAEFLPIREEDPKAPPNDYLKSKHEQEQLVMRLGRTQGLRYTILRPTGVYGPRGIYGMGRLLMHYASRNHLAVPRNFTTRIPFVHVRDVCAAAHFLCSRGEALGEAFNLNDDTQVNMVEFVRYMGDLTGKPVRLLPPFPVSLLKGILLGAAAVEKTVSRRFTHHPPNLEKDTIRFLGKDISYSNRKLKDLGYVFLYPDARVGIRETVEWYRKEDWI
ncbi:MAG: NAD-dependent epimerase/dehydratase family protein [bacterium]